MNPPIFRLYIFVLLLFGTLVYFTSNWAVFNADELEGKTQNKRPLIEQQQIPRGTITTSDGVLIAESLPEGGGREPVYVRRYPQGSLFGHPVGFAYVEANSEFERGENDLLVGEENEFQTIIDELRDVQPEGADVTVTLDAEAQRLATDLLSDAVTDPESPGASLVAIEPATGAVRVMASVPGYDPNDAQDDEALQQLQTDELRAPLVNRAIQSRYPPGSTMKVVTAAAALDSGEFDPDSVLNADSPKQISGVALENSGGASFGDIDMTTALTNSVNTYWAQVGEQLGTETMVEYMERFGFYADPKLDYPEDEMVASGVVSGDELVKEDFDVGRVAIGQGGAEGQILATATQMAEVAATIANGGTLMEPTFLQEAKDPDGRVIEELDPEEESDVISEEAASQLAEMMTNVTQEGTAAGLAGDLAFPFAGKTGTAEIDLEGTNQPWFITFAPTDDPQIAVAATVERCQGCFGGDTAGPIATAVMNSLLDN